MRLLERTYEQKIIGTYEQKFVMGSIKVTVDDKVEHRFRQVAMRKFGYGKGALSEAAETAFAEWSSKEDVDERITASIDDPVEAIQGLLKHVTESSIELQHNAGKIRVKKVLGQVSNRREYLSRA